MCSFPHISPTVEFILMVTTGSHNLHAEMAREAEMYEDEEDYFDKEMGVEEVPADQEMIEEG